MNKPASAPPADGLYQSLIEAVQIANLRGSLYELECGKGWAIELAAANLPALLDIAEAVALGERGAADPADIIAGSLGVSRGYAYGLMRAAVLPLAGESQ